MKKEIIKKYLPWGAIILVALVVILVLVWPFITNSENRGQENSQEKWEVESSAVQNSTPATNGSNSNSSAQEGSDVSKPDGTNEDGSLSQNSGTSNTESTTNNTNASGNTGNSDTNNSTGSGNSTESSNSAAEEEEEIVLDENEVPIMRPQEESSSNNSNTESNNEQSSAPAQESSTPSEEESFEVSIPTYEPTPGDEPSMTPEESDLHDSNETPIL